VDTQLYNFGELAYIIYGLPASHTMKDMGLWIPAKAGDVPWV
jgi:hypothetical protein